MTCASASPAKTSPSPSATPSFDGAPLRLRRRSLRRRGRAQPPRRPPPGGALAVLPHRLAGPGVQRVDRRTGRHEHHAVFHDGRGSRRAGVEFLRGPGAAQPRDGLRVDPIQRRIAAVVPVAADDGPLGAGGLAPVLVRRCRERQETRERHGKQWSDKPAPPRSANEPTVRAGRRNQLSCRGTLHSTPGGNMHSRLPDPSPCGAINTGGGCPAHVMHFAVATGA